MSTKRRTDGVYCSPTPLGPSGERLCRNCHGPMPPDKRKHNCSPRCVKEWRCKTSPQMMRRAVFERDHGVCATCGIDTEAEFRAKYGFTKLSGRPVGNWEADHIVPVIEGGGECGLDNYRTLCIPCHKKVTAELAARRAEERKAKQIQERIQEATARGITFKEAPKPSRRRRKPSAPDTLPLF